MRAPTLLALAATACSPSLDPGEGDDTGSSSEVTPGEAIINATSQTYWAYLDLESARIVEPDTPEDSGDWDLGFRRYKVMINGGVSGTGGMEVVPMPGVDYDTALDPPTGDWITDQPDDDDDGDLEYALDSWFDYDPDGHVVSPADIIYVVRTVEDSLVKLEFLGYYDDAGTPGFVHVHWGDLDDTWDDDTGDTGDTDPPDEVTCSTDASRVEVTDLGDGVQQAVLSTGSVEEWVCFSFDQGSVAEGWDLAGMKWDVLATGEVAELPGQDFDALTQAPADGYVQGDGSGEAFSTWYDYDSTEHVIEPQDKVYVVHTAGDAWYKLQFTSYYPDGDTSRPHHPTFRWAAVSAP